MSKAAEFTESLDQALAAEVHTPSKTQTDTDRAAFQRLSGRGEGRTGKRAASAKGAPAKGDRPEGEDSGGGGAAEKPRRRQPAKTSTDEVHAVEDARKRAAKASREALDDEWANLPEAPEIPQAQAEDEDGEGAGADDHDRDSQQGTDDDGEAPAKKGIAGLSLMQLAALRRADTPQEIIDSLSDAALVSLAEHEIKRQKAVDGLLSRQAQADKAQAKTGDEQRETTVSEDRESGGPNKGDAVPELPRSTDLKRVVRPLRESLGLDEEDEPKLAEALAAVAKSARDDLLGELAPKLKEQTKLLRSLEEERRTEAKHAAMHEAEVKWPRLADTQEKGKAKALADELYKAGSYPPELSFREAYARCFEDACYRTLGSPGIAPKARESTTRPQSTPSEADARRAAPRQLSKREQDLAVFKAQRRGEYRPGDHAGLRRAAGLAS